MLNFICLFIAHIIEISIISYMIYKTYSMFKEYCYSKKYQDYLDKLVKEDPEKYIRAWIEVRKINPNTLNKEIYEYLINL